MQPISLFDEAIDSVQGSDTFAYDIETTGLDPFSTKMLVLSLATKDGAWAIPFAGPVPHVPFDDPRMKSRIAEIFGNPEKLGIQWNGGFDIKHLMVRGHRILCRDADGLIGTWLLDEMIARSRMLGLKKQAKLHLGVDMKEFADTKLLDGIVEEEELAYASDDAKYTYILWHDIIVPKLVEQDFMKVFDDLLMPMTRVIVEMELNGIKVDVGKLHALENDLAASNIADLTEIRRLAGNDKFNPGSPKQLGELLFTTFKIPVKRGHEFKKRSKQWATDKLTLKRYSGDHNIVQHILDFRTTKKLLSTYVCPLQERAIDAHDGRIRPNIRMAATVTGRLASRNPNMQNIPIQSDSGRAIRDCFVAEDGCSIVGADYSQIELRMAGLLAYRALGHSSIAEAYRQGLDLHEATRRKYDGMGLVKFNEAASGKVEARRNAKIVNFGYMYGRGAAAFCEANPSVPFEEAQNLRNLWLYDMYPEVPAMHDHYVKFLVERGYALTLLGRRRRFPACVGRDPKDVWWDGWVCWNAIVQGSSQDVIQLAMRNLMRDLNEGRERGVTFELEPGVPTTFDSKLCKRIKILLQIHDELVLEAPTEHAELVSKWLAFRMGRALTGQYVEFPADSSHGRSWLSAH